METVHRTGNLLQCAMCEKFQSYRRDNTRAHLIKVHRLNQALVCPVCGISDSNMVSHVLSIHMAGDEAIMTEATMAEAVMADFCIEIP